MCGTKMNILDYAACKWWTWENVAKTSKEQLDTACDDINQLAVFSEYQVYTRNRQGSLFNPNSHQFTATQRLVEGHSEHSVDLLQMLNLRLGQLVNHGMPHGFLKALMWKTNPTGGKRGCKFSAYARYL